MTITLDNLVSLNAMDRATTLKRFISVKKFSEKSKMPQREILDALTIMAIKRNAIQNFNQ